MTELNPIKNENFDSKTFRPRKDDSDIRVRLDKMPKLLLTFDMFPPPIRDGQMIGMFESNQTIYLTFANKCNDLQKQIDELKKQINK